MAAIQSCDLSFFDAVLVHQAVALQSLFADLAVKASYSFSYPLTGMRLEPERRFANYFL